jgi:hypothetical protein
VRSFLALCTFNVFIIFFSPMLFPVQYI